MHGVIEGGKVVKVSGAKEGDVVVLTKGAGIEGTALIAREKRKELLEVYDEEFVNRAARFLFMPGLSILPEAKLALKFGVSAMHDPTEGGVAMGVYELAAASGTAVELWKDEVIIRKETARICAKYDIDPLGLLGSGALLATFRPAAADKFLAEVHKMGIDASVVGKVLPKGMGSRVVTGGKITPLSSSERDEVLRVLEP
jgi:hydrogenase maturation factor